MPNKRKGLAWLLLILLTSGVVSTGPGCAMLIEAAFDSDDEDEDDWDDDDDSDYDYAHSGDACDDDDNRDRDGPKKPTIKSQVRKVKRLRN